MEYYYTGREEGEIWGQQIQKRVSFVRFLKLPDRRSLLKDNLDRTRHSRDRTLSCMVVIESCAVMRTINHQTFILIGVRELTARRNRKRNQNLKKRLIISKISIIYYPRFIFHKIEQPTFRNSNFLKTFIYLFNYLKYLH